MSPWRANCQNQNFQDQRINRMVHPNLKTYIATELLLLVGNGAPMISMHLKDINEILTTVGLAAGIIASVTVYRDHQMKIEWKRKEQEKKNKEKSQDNEKGTDSY
jgi:hypothetical protein